MGIVAIYIPSPEPVSLPRWLPISLCKESRNFYQLPEANREGSYPLKLDTATDVDGSWCFGSDPFQYVRNNQSDWGTSNRRSPPQCLVLHYYCISDLLSDLHENSRLWWSLQYSQYFSPLPEALIGRHWHWACRCSVKGSPSVRITMKIVQDLR